GRSQGRRAGTSPRSAARTPSGRVFCRRRGWCRGGRGRRGWVNSFRASSFLAPEGPLHLAQGFIPGFGRQAAFPPRDKSLGVEAGSLPPRDKSLGFEGRLAPSQG